MRHWRYRERGVTRYLTAAAGGLLFPAAGVFCLAGVTMVCGLLPVWLTRAAAQLFWWMGAAWAGWHAGLHGRTHGVITGLLCGLLMSLAAVAAAWYVGEILMSRMLVRCVGMLVCGIAGGVGGVNVRIHRPPDYAHLLRRIGK